MQHTLKCSSGQSFLFLLLCENAHSLIPLGWRGPVGGLRYKVILIFANHMWLNHLADSCSTPAWIADVHFLQTCEADKCGKVAGVTPADKLKCHFVATCFFGSIFVF